MPNNGLFVQNLSVKVILVCGLCDFPMVIVCAFSGLLYSALGHATLALHSLSMAAKYQPQDQFTFLYRAEIYEKVLCLCLCCFSFSLVVQFFLSYFRSERVCQKLTFRICWSRTFQLDAIPVLSFTTNSINAHSGSRIFGV